MLQGNTSEWSVPNSRSQADFCCLADASGSFKPPSRKNNNLSYHKSHYRMGTTCVLAALGSFIFICVYIYITLFRFITILCGKDNIPRIFSVLSLGVGMFME
jgi:hypothetical protein